MDERVAELNMLTREFGHRINYVIREDIDSLPPAGTLYPKFYFKVPLLV